jgi:hypothetical protein
MPGARHNNAENCWGSTARAWYLHVKQYIVHIGWLVDEVVLACSLGRDERRKLYLPLLTFMRADHRADAYAVDQPDGERGGMEIPTAWWARGKTFLHH